jgi:hypothetical protein
MAKEQSHTGTTNPNPGSCVDCPVAISRRVSYLFKTGLWDKPLGSEKSLKIPYAIAIDGKVQSAFSKRAGTLHAYAAKDDIFVEPGQTVSLFLNSDAAPANRKNAVFAVTPRDNDVEVVVSEKRGKLGSDDTPKKTGTKEVVDKHGNKRKVDTYEATLSGDIWMKVSHKYTLDEAKTLIPAEFDQDIRMAVLKIYDGSLHGDLVVHHVSANGGDPQTLTLSFEPAQNAKENISAFDNFKDGLPRVHPQAWASVIEAGLKTGVSKVHTSSAWRPMLGAVVHRTGLGLDVNYLDTTRLNREELTKKNAPHTANVSEKEKKLFAEKEQADKETAEADAALKKLQKELGAINTLKKTSPGKVDPLREAALPKEITEADQKAQDMAKTKASANDAWNKERDKNEPSAIKSFRTELLHCKCVHQVFDPWFMEANTQNAVAEPNLQKTGNEKLHATHLHVTVNDLSLPTL